DARARNMGQTWTVKLPFQKPGPAFSILFYRMQTFHYPPITLWSVPDECPARSTSFSVLTDQLAYRVELRFRVILLINVKHIKVSISTGVLCVKLVSEVKASTNHAGRAIQSQVGKLCHKIRILAQWITARIEVPFANAHRNIFAQYFVYPAFHHSYSIAVGCRIILRITRSRNQLKA